MIIAAESHLFIWIDFDYCFFFYGSVIDIYVPRPQNYLFVIESMFTCVFQLNVFLFSFFFYFVDLYDDYQIQYIVVLICFSWWILLFCFYIRLVLLLANMKLQIFLAAVSLNICRWKYFFFLCSLSVSALLWFKFSFSKIF